MTQANCRRYENQNAKDVKGTGEHGYFEYTNLSGFTRWSISRLKRFLCFVLFCFVRKDDIPDNYAENFVRVRRFTISSTWCAVARP
jgi:hypothetical protein